MNIPFLKTAEQRLNALFVIAFLVSAAGFWLGGGGLILTGHDDKVPASWAASASIWAAWTWLVLLAVALWQARAKGLWLLAFAPFVLYFPYGWVMIAHDCSALGKCGSFLGFVAPR